MDADYWKKRADKSEWIHHEYVEMYEPYREKYGNGELPDNVLTKIKAEMNRIDSKADKMFGKF